MFNPAPNFQICSSTFSLAKGKDGANAGVNPKAEFFKSFSWHKDLDAQNEDHEWDLAVPQLATGEAMVFASQARTLQNLGLAPEHNLPQ